MIDDFPKWPPQRKSCQLKSWFILTKHKKEQLPDNGEEAAAERLLHGVGGGGGEGGGGGGGYVLHQDFVLVLDQGGNPSDVCLPLPGQHHRGEGDRNGKYLGRHTDFSTRIQNTKIQNTCQSSPPSPPPSHDPQTPAPKIKITRLIISAQSCPLNLISNI